MRVLLTGCNGQVGFILKELLQNSVELLALTHQELDITNKESVNKTVSVFRPNVIVNAAAYTAVDKAEKEEQLAFSVNSNGPEHLAEAANKIDSVLIHISTDYVFEGNKIGLYKETDHVNPQGSYGKSKLAGEKLVTKKCKKHIILRTAWVFGEHGNNFVKTMLKLGKDKRKLSVVNDQFGGPTYAGDIAKAIIKIINKIEICESIKWGVYHYSGMPYVSWYEFAKCVFISAERNGILENTPKLTAVTSDEFPTQVKRPKNSKLNCKSVEAEFGVLPSAWQTELNNIKNYT